MGTRGYAVLSLVAVVVIIVVLMLTYPLLHGAVNANAGVGASGDTAVFTINNAQCPIVVFNYTLTLPSKFSVLGYYGKLLNETIGTNTLSTSDNGPYGSVRIAWHVASLTIVFGDNVSGAEESWLETTGMNITVCRIIYTVRTQVLEVKINNTWVEVPPIAIKGNYTENLSIEAPKGVNATQVMKALDKLIRTGRSVPPPQVLLSPPSSGGPPFGVYWPTLPPLYVFVSDVSWSLSAFAKIGNNMSEICGYVYPANSSDLVLPSSDYAGVPLSVWQGGYDVNGHPVTLLIQGVAQIWHPALEFNVWFLDPWLYFNQGIFGYAWIGGMNLTSPVDWLGEGVSFCISISQVSTSEYSIAIDGYVGNTQYEMATVTELINGSNSEVTVTPGGGFTQQLNNVTSSNELVPVTNYTNEPLSQVVSLSQLNNDIGSVQASALGLDAQAAFYPSMAFETNDTSSSFYGDNTNFALYLQMASSLSNLENAYTWELYYSISYDVYMCAGIWGSSGIGSAWPPSSTTSQWGASGFYIDIPSYPPGYTAAIGSISRMNNLGLTNTVGISCQYVDTDLTPLNAKG